MPAKEEPLPCEEEAGAPEEEQESGAPAWVMTFADLMSLLMCFFVLLLSFSEIEATKFKQMAGSMQMAFGVQRKVEAPEPPKGTSVIAQEFSPGRPEPTPLNEVRQSTTEEQPNLEVIRHTEALKAALEQEIAEGMIDVESHEDRIVIRIREQGSFPSGSDQLNPRFLPVLDRIRDSLATMPGKIDVVGHTDNLPISTTRFRSNWDLSAARAGSVLHQLLEGDQLNPSRMELMGLADVQPLQDNNSPDQRAANRRVEIVIWTGKTK